MARYRMKGDPSVEKHVAEIYEYKVQ
jgi:hypothetical protein